MKLEKKYFGSLSNGRDVDMYILDSGELCLHILTLGATWTSLFVPSKHNKKEDILLGYSTLTDYTKSGPYLGVSVGRFANRIGGASFTLNGTRYILAKNDGNNTLHGGCRGFDKQVWDAEGYEENGGVFLKLSLFSPDGDEGFPGDMNASITYGFTADHKLICSYHAELNAECPVNFTNHAYFNLKGEGNGDILDHELRLHSSRYLEVDKALIPTGNRIQVAETPFDFLKAKELGRDIAKTPAGYDHCFIVDGDEAGLRPCAEVTEKSSGRTLKLSTTQPGVQLYTGNFLNSLPGKLGSTYNQYAGFCLETQHFPDSPNRPDFPSCIFGPGKDYDEQSVFSFEW